MADFKPDARQVKFRALVARLFAEDDLAQRKADEVWRDDPVGPPPKVPRRWSLRHWCAASRAALEPVAPSEYRAWEMDPGFADWWQDGCDAFAPVTKAELAYADRAHFEAMVDHLDDPRVQRTFQLVRAATQDDKEDKLSAAMQEMLEHMAAVAERNPWLNGGMSIGEAK